MDFFIDCTDLIKNNLNTGIQRVARNIVNNSSLFQKISGIKCEPVYYDEKYGFIKVSGVNKNNLIQSFGYLYTVRMFSSKFWHFRQLIECVFPLPEFHNWLINYWKGFMRWFLVLPLSVAIFPIIFSAVIYTIFRVPKNIWQPTKNNVFIIPGSSWLDDNIQNGIKNIKNAGGFIVVLCHDIFPILHPEYCVDNLVKNFTVKFPLIISRSDLIVANSRSTKRMINEYFIKSEIVIRPSMNHFVLGADLDLTNKTIKIRKSLKSLFSKNQPYICVGTIEPRKNLSFLLDAFDEIWKTNRDVCLCLIGRYGWKSLEMIQRIKSHQLFGNNLIWYKDLNDTELTFCYNKSKALILPSINEGFGLPIVEALNHGCPVIASDIPIFREVGGEKCTYFNLEKVFGLVSLINEYEKCGYILGKNKNYKRNWINWEESAINFYTIVADHFYKY